MIEKKLGNSEVAKTKGTDGKKTWASVAGNRDSGSGEELTFIPPNSEGEVEFTEEDLDEGAEIWKNAIVGETIGVSPSFKEMVGFVHRAWSRYEIPRIHLPSNQVFSYSISNLRNQRKIF